MQNSIPELYMKTSLKSKEEIQTFSNKQKMRELKERSTLKETLKKVLQVEVVCYPTELSSTQKNKVHWKYIKCR